MKNLKNGLIRENLSGRILYIVKLQKQLLSTELLLILSFLLLFFFKKDEMTNQTVNLYE